MDAPTVAGVFGITRSTPCPGKAGSSLLSGTPAKIDTTSALECCFAVEQALHYQQNRLNLLNF
jgi:hypothetical protein